MRFYLLGIFLFLCIPVSDGLSNTITYSVPEKPWDESLGNHRAVIDVDESAEAVLLDLPWRRHDEAPADKRFIILHSDTKDTIQNIHRLKVDEESCRIIFGPVVQGTYEFYYLPFQVQKGHGFYYGDYLKPESPPDKDWFDLNIRSRNNNFSDLHIASYREIQSRTVFDSFYPMEVAATKTEVKQLREERDHDFLLFPEDRAFPIRMTGHIPLRWIHYGLRESFSGTALRNEYYVFQVGVYAARKRLDTLVVTFSDLIAEDGSLIAKQKLTCFNTEGINPYGIPFTKYINVKTGSVQPLWIGADISDSTKPGIYRGRIYITPSNTEGQSIPVKLTVQDAILEDRGDSEPWRHSRLRWLNSTAGISTDPIEPFDALRYPDENTCILSGKRIKFSRSGLPSEVYYEQKPLLQGPVDFIIEADSKYRVIPAGSTIEVEHLSGLSRRITESSTRDLDFQIRSTVEFDGYMNFQIKIVPRADAAVDDIRLEIPLQRALAAYMIGMGLPGCDLPEKHHSKWSGPEDSFWIGGVAAGIWVELRGTSYHGPLLNLYKPEPPDSWHNGGKGGFRIETEGDLVRTIVYSGGRKLLKNQPLEFEFSLLLTPVKKIDTRSQFTDRYYHQGGRPVPSEEEWEAGIRIVNIHHANVYNPYINYPFLAVDTLKHLVNRLHSKGKKVKLYYTIRELSNHVTEIWALRSLGNEILAGGNGGGYPWLREHFVDNYTPQWYHHFAKERFLPDASILTATGDSRWYNYYIEGLGWLVKLIEIDGLYLDDVAFDRRMLKRMRRIMNRHKADCLLDLHSNTGFSKGPAKQYTEFFPYVDKLWFGESFLYDQMSPANWLIEVSGIPFGLMGDMLHGGGNPWLGMVYGMTVRYPWTTEGISCDPRDIWQVWDEFGIENAEMVGYWDDNPIVSTNDPEVLSTAYLKPDKIMISVGNFSDSEKKIQLNIDWDRAGITNRPSGFNAPYIKHFQKENRWSLNQAIELDPRKGHILIIE